MEKIAAIVFLAGILYAAGRFLRQKSQSWPRYNIDHLLRKK